jgi:adenylate cyclase
MRAEYPTARALGEEVVALAERLGRPELAADARPSLGAVFLGLGDLTAARYQAERGRDRLDPERPTVHAISSCMLLATTSAYQGRVARTQAFVREAVTLPAKTDTPYVRAHVTTMAAGQCQLIGDVAGARSFADDAVRLATEWDLPIYRILATIYRAWCDVHEGRAEQGLAALRGAFAEYAVCGQRQGTSAYAALLAEAHLANDDVIGASQALDAAFAFMAETGDRSCAHELHRLRGECLLARAENRSQKAQAAECFERAIAIAAEQQALLFELRAATGLFRLRGTVVRERVVRLVDRFPAEDECPDLRAARAVLAR